MKRLKNLLNVNEIKFDFHTEFANSMSSFMKVNAKVALEWLKKHYPNATDVVNIVSRQMGKDFKVVLKAVLADKKL